MNIGDYIGCKCGCTIKGTIVRITKAGGDIPFDTFILDNNDVLDSHYAVLMKKPQDKSKYISYNAINKPGEQA